MKNPENEKMEMSVITETGEVQPVKKLTPTKKKAIIGAAVILGASTLVLGGIMQIALAAETSTIENVKTTYSASTIPDQQKPNDMEGYVKGNYTVQSVIGSEKPRKEDISMQQAADIGAQNIWRFFGDNLDGKTIQMRYDPYDNSWRGFLAVEVNGLAYETVCYDFEVHALSGVLGSVGQSRIYPSSVREKFNNLDYDANLETHHDEYEKLARETVAKHHLLSGKITSVDYSGQGYGSDGRSIELTVRSEIGEMATLRYSCEDKSLLNYFSYDWQFAAKLRYAKESEQEIGVMKDANGNVWLPTQGNSK